ncbi:biliverdin-producing heme oxygenase [Devosia soli]|uniref:biliverdin-producing heme oxygenase n=1 Tax=Devosia soli TaxID=361041 RepID=UPI00128CE0E3|nr:biliverdin-producing heme oxygenase [Devosia soli]
MTMDLRADLRRATAAVHEELDASVGQFNDRASYGRYLHNTLAFRERIEPALAQSTIWSTPSLLDDLHADRDDLELAVLPAKLPVNAITDASRQIGAFYVLEGSCLGARLLVRRAEAIGLTGLFGARHLAAQAGDAGRWRNFLSLLDRAEDLDPARAIDGALAVFEVALAIYTEKIGERSQGV